MNKKERKTSNTTQILKTLSLTLLFFCLFLIKSQGTLTSTLCCFFQNLSNLFWLFAAILLSKFFILLISFTKLLKDKNPYFLVMYICAGLNYLFRSYLWKFSWSFQQVGDIREHCTLPLLGIWCQNAIQMQENSVQFNTFWCDI